jgi:protein gp37
MMGRKAGWWDQTSNFTGGCKAASPGCGQDKVCYAAMLAATQQFARGVELYQGVTDWVRGKPVFNGKRTVLPPDHPSWRWLLTWPGAKHPNLGPGKPSLVFVGDMSDVFFQPRPAIDQVVSTIVHSPHIGLLQTKYCGAMVRYFTQAHVARMKSWRRKMLLGFSAENQEWFNKRWAHMRRLADDGWFVFVAIAPMLGPVTLPPDFLAYGPRVWCIVSGEQRVKRDIAVRPMNPDWARALRDQCIPAGVPFFMNQMAGRKLIPPDLFVQQFPNLQVEGPIGHSQITAPRPSSATGDAT